MARARRHKLALLIAAHNEELVIEQTLRSAIHAGMKPENIYVVDDNSTDATSLLASAIIGEANVIKVRRSGKGLALSKAAKRFKLAKRYLWIHIADADGGFATDYFRIFRRELDPQYVAATGYVSSLPGSSVSQYRVMEYTVGMEIHRRFQALTNMITVIPGPTSCFRSDIFKQLNFANKSLTEDFDVTLQLHRKKLGRIQFITTAVAYTQDPKNVKDYIKQIKRWNRGTLQGLRRHRIGTKLTRVDAYLLYQVLQNLSVFFFVAGFMPYWAVTHHNSAIFATIFLYDVALTFIIVALSALKARRGDILSAFPVIYLLRWITLGIFMQAFVEILILRKFRVTEGVWGTAGRRYKSDILLRQAA